MTAEAATRVVDAALLTWFALTAASVLYVAWDAFARNPEMGIMKWGWILVTLYTGPVGGALYVLSCQEPGPMMHERFIRPLWKQSLGSTIHCLAGDATGIIAAAIVTMALGLPMGLDLVAEYAFGFAFGLLVFQALFMRDMLGGSYAKALARSFLPEWLSMNAVMAGMIPVMVVLMTRHMSAMEPTSLHFWGVMSLATLAGAAVAYPVNAWLVAAGLKHGMGTVRVLGQGGHSAAHEMRLKQDQAAAGRGGGVAPAREAMAEAMDMDAGPRARAGDGAHTLPGPTRPQIAAVAVLSLVALGAGLFLAAVYGDLAMSGRMAAHAGGAMGRMPMP